MDPGKQSEPVRYEPVVDPVPRREAPKEPVKAPVKPEREKVPA